MLKRNKKIKRDEGKIMKENMGYSKQDREFTDWMREYYNKKVSNRRKGYEHSRWFSSPRHYKQYLLSKTSILHHLKGAECKNILEIGCGPGTWTRFLLDRFPKAKITSVDLSKEMIKELKRNIKSKRVKTVVGSFLDVKLKKESYDLVFFSRAIEYIPNKPLVIKKMEQAMAPGARGIIITSPPHPTVIRMKKILGKKVDKNHSKRISVKEMGKLLKKNNFEEILFYPILFSDFLPIPREFLFNRYYKKRWGVVAKMLASGYLVKFYKPKK